MIKKILLLATIILAAACTNNEEKAGSLLNEARGLYEIGALNSAKVQIDSLRATYPKEFKVVKQGIQLMREIEVKEHERTLAYTDSLLLVKTEEATMLEKEFVYLRDTIYEEIGNYTMKGMSVERNIERSYIRTGVNEYGEIYIASVYFGGGSINHTGVRFEIKDGSNAETLAIPYDGGRNFRFSDGGNKSEIVTYKAAAENGVIAFINHYNEERIKVTYTGGKPYIIYLDDFSKKAILKTFELATVLTDITRLKQENKIAAGKIEFLKKRIADKAETL